MLTKNSKNAEIEKLYSARLEAGETIIYAIQDSNSGANKVAFVAQKIRNAGSNPATALFLGWGDRIVRGQQRIAENLVKNFKVGQSIPLDILVQESTTQSYEGQSPKVNPSTSEVITFNNQEVYEHTSLVAKGQGGVKRLQRQVVESHINV